MSEGNGDHVTWRELNLLRQTIDERFDHIEELLEDRKVRSRYWFPPLLAALVSAVIAIPVAALIH